MSLRGKGGTLAVTVAGVVLALARDAMAYVDPGTGSLILQVLLGLILAASFWFRRTLRNALTFLTKLLPNARKQPPEQK